VLDRLSLAVRHGKFLTILGPSGSGKSTLLRLIASLEVPDAGRVPIDGRVARGEECWLPPQRLAVGMVFQNCELWPHMTACENMAFPPGVQGVARRDAARRAREVLALVELAGLADKPPGQASGGEQQRAALARALAAQAQAALRASVLTRS
jgi:ABC-type sugar transport system ATPase subunit